MKIAILGDLHLGVKNSSDIMLEHQRKFFEFFFSYLIENTINTVIQLGDLFDNRRQINLKTLKFAQTYFFNQIDTNKINFHSLIGNHDIFYRENLDINSSEILLQAYDTVKIYNVPTTVTFGNKSFDFIPWICAENKDACLKYISESKSDFCCGHFEIENFQMMGNIFSQGGLKNSLFKNYKKVFSGHFHIKSSRDNIMYVGTPYELNWGDAFDIKGFYILDTDTEEITFIENPLKYFVYLTYDETEHNITDFSKMNLENCFVKVIVKSKIEPFVFETYIGKIYKNKPADLRVVNQDLLEVNESDNQNKELKVKDIPDLIETFISDISISDNEKKNMLKIFMLNLYNEAISDNHDNKDF